MIAVTNYANASLQRETEVSLVQTAAGVVPETRVTQNWLLVGDVVVINLEPQHALQPRGIKGRCRCWLCCPLFSCARCCVEPEEDAAELESELRRTRVTTKVQVQARTQAKTAHGDKSSRLPTAGSTEAAAAVQRQEREREVGEHERDSWRPAPGAA